MLDEMIIEEYIFANESLQISIEILFKNVYEKYEKGSELYFVTGLSGEIFFCFAVIRHRTKCFTIP